MTTTQTRLPMITEGGGTPSHWYDSMLTGVTGGAVLAFLAGLLKLAERCLPFLVKRRRELDVVSGITDQSQIYVQMEKAIQEDGAQRVLMLSVHNDGDIPKATSGLYVSAIHVVADTMERRQRASNYKEVLVDSHYIEMIKKLASDGHYRFNMEDHEHTLLHQFYKSEGVTDAVMCYLGVWKCCLIFISFSTYDGEFTEQQMVRHRIRAMTIRDLMKKG